MRIGIFGPYTAPTVEQRDINILRAREATAEILRLGHEPYCPHTQTAGMEVTDPDIEYEAYMRTTLSYLEVLDAGLFLHGWEKSPGTEREHARAVELGVIRFYDVSEVPPTR